jgi:hypothetical protein
MPELKHRAWVTILGFAAGVLLMSAGMRFKEGSPEPACVSLFFASFWFGWSLLLGQKLEQREPARIPTAKVHED